VQRMIPKRLNRLFFQRDVLLVAPDLLGKLLCRKLVDGSIVKYAITEVEAYRGEEDLACHAAKGHTKRTEVMYGDGGYIYVYLIYGKYWMLNFVVANAGDPQAILIRGVHSCSGPGRLTKLLDINGTFYAEDLISSKRIWIEDIDTKPCYKTSSRIGIEYAGLVWGQKPWRFYYDNE
jgi:DNA-3-methyladenine glycosylase